MSWVTNLILHIGGRDERLGKIDEVNHYFSPEFQEFDVVPSLGPPPVLVSMDDPSLPKGW